MSEQEKVPLCRNTQSLHDTPQAWMCEHCGEIYCPVHMLLQRVKALETALEALQ